MLVHVAPLSRLTCHCRAGGGVPLTTTLNSASAPNAAVALAGWAPMAAAAVAGAGVGVGVVIGAGAAPSAGTAAEVSPPPAPPPHAVKAKALPIKRPTSVRRSALQQEQNFMATPCAVLKGVSM